MAAVDQARLRAIIGTAIVEAEANDPARLRQRIADLEAAARKRTPAAMPSAPPDPAALADAERRGRDAGRSETLREVATLLGPLQAILPDAAEAAPLPMSIARVPLPTPARAKPRSEPKAQRDDGGLTGPQAQLLQAIAWWAAMGHPTPTRVQVAPLCGWRVTSGHLKNIAGSLRALGLIDYPGAGTLAMTTAGAAAAPEPELSASIEGSLRAVLTNPQQQVLQTLPIDGTPMPRDEIARACGWEPTSGHLKNIVGSMRSLELVTYPSQGLVARETWLTEAA